MQYSNRREVSRRDINRPRSSEPILQLVSDCGKSVRGPARWRAGTFRAFLRRAKNAVGTRTRDLALDERGAVTAEYAVIIMAAVAFAGLLVVILRSSEVRGMLVDLVQNALGSAG